MNDIYVIERQDGEYSGATWSAVAWYPDEQSAQRHVIIARERAKREPSCESTYFAYHKVPAGDPAKLAAKFAAQREAGLIPPGLSQAVDDGIVPKIREIGRQWKPTSWNGSLSDADVVEIAERAGCGIDAVRPSVGWDLEADSEPEEC